MELYRETQSGISIVAQATVMTYTYSGDTPRIVIIRLEAGDDAKPIAGGGTYVLNVTIDDTPCMPVSNVAVPGTENKAIFQTRAFVLEPGDVIKALITGLAGDGDINTVTSLSDMTPAQIEDLAGAGDTSVNHNFGGIDNLRVVDSTGAPVEDASISAYLKTDYDAGNTGGTYVKGRTTTGADGRWLNPMGLSAGTYVLVTSKPGQFTSAATQIEVV